MIDLPGMVSMVTVLCQQGKLSQELRGLFVILGVIALGVVILAAVIATIRKKWLSDQPPETDAAPFSLSELRRLFREGQLSEAEFDKAKAQIIAMHSGDNNGPAAEETVEKPDGEADNPQ